jgi:hypothetical protein
MRGVRSLFDQCQETGLELSRMLDRGRRHRACPAHRRRELSRRNRLFGRAEPSSIVSNIRKQPGPVVKQRDEAAERQQRKPVEADNREFARRLWCQAVDPRGTIVEAYLRNRCLELPGEAANEAIRFHPDCPFGMGSSSARPAMVCVVRNIVSNEPQGLHRTALAPDGTAIKRTAKHLE